MTAAFLDELARLFRAEADGIADSYAWPPRGPLTDEERFEIQRLDATANRIHYRSVCS